jgi:hypothetical protein
LTFITIRSIGEEEGSIGVRKEEVEGFEGMKTVREENWDMDFIGNDRVLLEKRGKGFMYRRVLDEEEKSLQRG